MFYSRYQHFRGTYCLLLQGRRNFSCIDDGGRMFPWDIGTSLLDTIRNSFNPAENWCHLLDNKMEHKMKLYHYEKKTRISKIVDTNWVTRFCKQNCFYPFFLDDILNRPHETPVLQIHTFRYLLWGWLTMILGHAQTSEYWAGTAP